VDKNPCFFLVSYYDKKMTIQEHLKYALVDCDDDRIIGYLKRGVPFPLVLYPDSPDEEITRLIKEEATKRGI
jgi:hypothetical protein